MHDATRAGSGQLRALVDDHSYDAIVVGTGISGGRAAKELTEKGLKTLVLDRGRMVRHGDYPTAMKDPWELPYGGRATQEDLRRHAIGARSNVITQASKHWFDHVEGFIGVSGQAENLPQLPDGKFLPPMELNCVEQRLRRVLADRFGRTLTIGRAAHLTAPLAHSPQRGTCQYRNLCIRGCPLGAYFSSNSS